MSESQPRNPDIALTTIIFRSLAKVLKDNTNILPPMTNHWHFGAVDRDPNDLVVVFAYRNLKKLAEASEGGHIERVREEMLHALEENGYPLEVLSEIAIRFVSEEEVNNAGGPWIYFSEQPGE